MIEKRIDHMDLEQIAKSGQCFRWQLIGENTYSIVYRDYAIEIEQKADSFLISCEEGEWEAVWREYFDLVTDYFAVEKKIDEKDDLHLQEAFCQGSGIRILKQDLWEMIVTFMISQNNNISRITKSVDELCTRTGILVQNQSFLNDKSSGRRYRFPMPGEVNLEIFEDKTMGLGYRNTYLREIYEFAANNSNWLDELIGMDYDLAFENLIARKGIGKKVANCICLFGLHHIDAFPIDTHVKQLLDKYYADGFDFEYFKGIGGIIQQYLFYYELKNK